MLTDGKVIKIISDSFTYKIVDKILVATGSNVNETFYLTVRITDNSVHLIKPSAIIEIL